MININVLKTQDETISYIIIMPIKVKTRKILWSKSGNRCAICKTKLVQKIENITDSFIIGEECHIISSKENGPRGYIVKLDDYDNYNNLILLCPTHHKMIDEYPETFTNDIIVSLKNNHENWIEEAIEKDLAQYVMNINNIEKLDEINNHHQLDNIIKNAHFYFFDSSSILDSSLSIKIAEIFEELQDISDIYSDIEISNKTKYLINCENEINNLRESKIRFFGKPLLREYTFNNIPKDKYKIAMLVAFDETTNPLSIQNGQLIIKLPDNFEPTL